MGQPGQRPNREVTADSPAIPGQLSRALDGFDLLVDRSERINALIETAERWQPVPSTIATRPYGDEHRTPACESEVYLFAVAREDGTLDFHFAVENPQGISAKAMAVILTETLSGAPLDLVARVSGDLVYRLFGDELSMGKSMGLMGMVAMVQRSARSASVGAAGD